jgi:hypothetical protein
VVVAVVALASGVFASTAVRGALPAIAQLPWIGVAASALFDAQDRRSAIRATIGLALALGCVGLTGVLAALFDGVVIAGAIAARRKTLPYVAIALGAGLAISGVQWVPALLAIGTGAGEIVTGLPPSRFLELVVPGSFGASDPDRAVLALAGDHAWAPSLFVGAALFALSAVRTPSRRVLVVIGISSRSCSSPGAVAGLHGSTRLSFTSPRSSSSSRQRSARSGRSLPASGAR